MSKEINVTSRRHAPAVSVIIPVYNAESYLRETFDSVLEQTLTDLQIIVVNDCSTDSSAKICDEYAQKDSRIKVFHLPENRGPGVARNLALDYADGEYCTFLDSDDRIHPNALKEMYEFALRNKLDIVRCEMGRFSDVDSVIKPIFQQYGKERIFTRKDEILESAVCIFSSPVSPGRVNLNFGGSACSALHHRSLFENGGVRFPKRPHMICEDFIFCYDCMRRARNFGLLPKRLYYYRYNPKSRTNIPRTDILQRAFRTAEDIEQMIIRDGFDKKYLEHAYLFVFSVVRSFVKNVLLSDMSIKEKKKWFESQHDYPILQRAYQSEYFKYLPKLHRLNFECFYHRRFFTMFIMLKIREIMR
ncbi:MAG: glycosyltransferase family 2 protein [Prevotella sp.]|nr:glycosyltransferase family 2 protein [Bacteroides sp.]MCM1366099.1 glycosyltransferase family 2 protein [Prevotella sp.]MCM1436584.1 glycosyltransferase family 2 protein [Prevotella sp.]